NPTGRLVNQTLETGSTGGMWRGLCLDLQCSGIRVYGNEHSSLKDLQEKLTNQLTTPSAEQQKIRRNWLPMTLNERLNICRGGKQGGSYSFGSCAGLQHRLQKFNEPCRFRLRLSLAGHCWPSRWRKGQCRLDGRDYLFPISFGLRGMDPAERPQFL